MKKGAYCKYFEQGFGACFLNGSPCCWPFSEEGCEIQGRNIFKDNPAVIHYDPDGLAEGVILTKSDVYKRIGIKRGDVIADYFTPYSEILTIRVSPAEIIKDAWEMIDKKFTNEGYSKNSIHHRRYVNVMIGDQAGIYQIGVIRP